MVTPLKHAPAQIRSDLMLFYLESLLKYVPSPTKFVGTMYTFFEDWLVGEIDRELQLGAARLAEDREAEM